MTDLESAKEEVVRDEQRIAAIETVAKDIEARLNASDVDRLDIWTTLEGLAATRRNITSLQGEVMSLMDWANDLTAQDVVRI